VIGRFVDIVGIVDITD